MHRVLLRPLSVPSEPDRLDGEAADLLIYAIWMADASFNPRSHEVVLVELVVRLDSLPLALGIVGPQFTVLGPVPVLTPESIRRFQNLSHTVDEREPVLYLTGYDPPRARHLYLRERNF